MGRRVIGLGVVLAVACPGVASAGSLLVRSESAGYWPGAHKPRTKPRQRPRTVTIPHVAKLLKVRWRKFGGRKAVGFGRLRRIDPPGARCRACPEQGRRFKVVLPRPSRCRDQGEAVWYGRVSFYTLKRLPPYIPAGGLYSYYKPACAQGDLRPV